MMNEIAEIIETDDTISEADADLLQELAEDAETDESETSAEDAHEEASADIAEGYLRQIAELTEKLRATEEERAARERELLCLSLLNEAGLPAALAPAVQASEDMVQTVELINSTVRSCVEAELLQRCRTETPLTGSKTPLTKEELMRMPVAELQRLRNSGAVLG